MAATPGYPYVWYQPRPDRPLHLPGGNRGLYGTPKELASVTVSVLGKAETSFFIAQVTDMRSGSVNDLLTPGRNAKIAGSKLKIAGERPECGV
jgi:hypothetical protein